MNFEIVYVRKAVHTALNSLAKKAHPGGLEVQISIPPTVVSVVGNGEISRGRRKLVSDGGH